MKQNMPFVTVLGLMLLSGAASAKELKGVTFPDGKQVAGSTLVLNGLGLRQATALKVSVYVAALYVAAPSSDPAAILGADTPKDF